MNRIWTLSVLAAAVAGGAFGAWEYDQVDKVDLAPFGAIVDGWRAAKPKAKRRVLLFSECFGYNHHGGRCYGDWAFERAGRTSGAWEIERTTDVTKLADAAFLSAFDALLLNNSSGVSEAMAPGLTDALKAFENGGKGVALIHAGLDAFKDSDGLLDLFGGYFRGHPWHGDGTWRFLNERPAHPVNASFRGLPASFAKTDEIYQFPAFFNRKSCTVLVSMDLTDPATKAAEQWWNGFFGPGSTRADHDYAVSWVKDCGKGRVFYTSFGHDRNAYLDPQRLYHMFAGLQYVLGDLPASGPAEGPAIAKCRTDWANGPCRERMEERAKSLKGKSLDFVFFGDSITMGWTYPATNRWTGGREVWERHFGRLEAANFGVSGDRTEHVLWRVTDGRQADGWQAKTIFIMIGINNSGRDAAEDAAAGAKAIVAALKARHPESRIVLFGALPAHGKDKIGWVRRYNRALSAFAEKDKVAFLDVTDDFLRPDGTLDQKLFRDGLHPNPAGYEVLAARMDEILGK